MATYRVVREEPHPEYGAARETHRETHEYGPVRETHGGFASKKAALTKAREIVRRWRMDGGTAWKDRSGSFYNLRRCDQDVATLLVEQE